VLRSRARWKLLRDDSPLKASPLLRISHEDSTPGEIPNSKQASHYSTARPGDEGAQTRDGASCTKTRTWTTFPSRTTNSSATSIC
jgi:hypothetical protein